MNEYINARAYENHYIAHKKKQCDQILNCPELSLALQKEGLRHKWKRVSSNEKVKLVLKKAAGHFGVQKSLFTGDYMPEEDIRQCFQDMEIYYNILGSLNQSDFNIKSYETGNKSAPLPKLYHKDFIGSLKKLLTGQRSYIALMVKTLDSGGLEQVVKLLTLQLRSNNIAVTVFCTEHGGRTAVELRNEGTEVIEFHGNKSLFRSYVKENRPLLANTHFASDFYDILAQYRIPIVEVIHNMYVFLTAKQLEAEKEKANYITHYIAVSETAKEIFCRKIPQVSGDRVTVIGNSGAKQELPAREGKEIREAFGIPKDAFIYLAAGSIDARKNQLGILRALDIVRYLTDQKVLLLLAGEETDSAYCEKLHRFTESCSLQESVIFLGYSNRLFELMEASDVLILDSYYEGWSMAATEALFCGLPLIHSDCGSGRELTAGGANGILIDNPIRNISSLTSVELYDAMHMGVNENMAQLVWAMLYFLNNRELWRERRNKIREYAGNQLSVSGMLQQYAKVFDECCRKDMTTKKP